VSRSTPPFGGDDDVLDRLLRTPDDASRLRALLNAATADSDEPQPGEAAALAAYRELVQEPAGIPSLTRRRQARLAVAAISSVVVLVGSGVAAAAGGALPDGAQQVAKTVLGAVGVHVPGPAGGTGSNDHGTEPASDASPTPSGAATYPAVPAQPDRPSTTPEPKPHPSTPPTPGNSGPSRHHGNPTPHATTHPTPHHGKPTAPPTTSHRQSPNSHAIKLARLAARLR
jgi:hypothetical protein